MGERSPDLEPRPWGWRLFPRPWRGKRRVRFLLSLPVDMNAASERHEIPTENIGSDAKPLTVNLRKVRVEVVQGPDRGAVVELGDKSLLIGRAPACGLVLTDGSVSWMHAELSLVLGGVQIRNLGSRNGVQVGAALVEDARVEPGNCDPHRPHRVVADRYRSGGGDAVRRGAALRRAARPIAGHEDGVRPAAELRRRRCTRLDRRAHRNRQGSGGARAPRSFAAQGRPLRDRRLRRHSAPSHGGRAVRRGQGRLHRRRFVAAGHLRARRRRHRRARRDRRAAHRAAAEASRRHRARQDAPPRRVARARRSRRASSPPPIACSRARCRRAASARISTSA